MAANTSGTNSSNPASSFFSNTRMAGLMSGLDTENLVKAMAMNTKNRLNSKQQKLQTLQWKQSAYRDIISKVSEFQTKYLSIDSSSSIKANAVMNKFKAESSNDKVGASAVSSAVPATYTIKEAKAATKASISSDGVGTIDKLALDFSKNKRNTDYTVKVTLDGTTMDVEFNSGSNAENAKASFLAAVNSAFDKFKRDDQKFEFKPGTTDLTFNTGGEEGITHTYTVGYNSEAVGISNNASNMITRNTALGDIAFATELHAGANDKYEFSINGVNFKFDKDTTIATMINDINKSEAGVTMTFSSVNQSFKLESNATGTSGKIDINQKSGNLISAIFNKGNGLSTVSADKTEPIKIDDGSGNGTKRNILATDFLDTTANELKFNIKSENMTITRTVTASDSSGKLTYQDLINSGLVTLEDGVLKATPSSPFSAAEAGSESENLLKSLFGKTTVQGEHTVNTLTVYGQNGTLTVSSDGENYKTYTSASNDYTFDGTTINIDRLGNFKADEDNEEITITTSKDTSAIKETIKQFVDDYNNLIEELYKTVKTARPKSKGSYYDPLTDEQKEEMTKEEIEKWEENAKTGLLYQDNYIQSLVMSVRGVMSSAVDGMDLFRMGIKSKSLIDASGGFSDNYGKLYIDESKLDSVIESKGDELTKFFTDPDRGLASKLNTAIDKAVKNSAASGYGYLTKLAGIENTTSEKKNSLYSQINSLQRIITDLQKKYENEMERYWKKFTALETYMSNMQQQSSIFDTGY